MFFLDGFHASAWRLRSPYLLEAWQLMLAGVLPPAPLLTQPHYLQFTAFAALYLLSCPVYTLHSFSCSHTPLVTSLKAWEWADEPNEVCWSKILKMWAGGWQDKDCKHWSRCNALYVKLECQHVLQSKSFHSVSTSHPVSCEFADMLL